MSESKKGVFNLFSYIALILAALLLVVYNLLPLVGVNVGGTFFGGDRRGVFRLLFRIFHQGKGLEDHILDRACPVHRGCHTRAVLRN